MEVETIRQIGNRLFGAGFAPPNTNPDGPMFSISACWGSFLTPIYALLHEAQACVSDLARYTLAARKISRSMISPRSLMAIFRS